NKVDVKSPHRNRADDQRLSAENLFSKAAAEEMSLTYIISVFVRELPGCILFGWIFMSVALFLLMLIAYFRMQLSEGESQFRSSLFQQIISVYL
uniref:Uncharacterized protein n=1 Tax=Anser brachyrhynchus TaxID=132585 RepID=A0A8B9BUH7_9AVES